MKRKLIVALIVAILCTLGTMVAAQEPDEDYFTYLPYVAVYPVGPTLTPSPTPRPTPGPVTPTVTLTPIITITMTITGTQP